MSDTLKKLLVVVSLTVLIWAWAYMSQQQDHIFTGTLGVASATDSDLLVTFSFGDSLPQTEIPLTSLNLVGAPSRLSELLKRNNLSPTNQDKEQMDFYYDPVEQGRTEGAYSLELLEYLQKSSKIQELALTLESCTPSQIDVKIESLVEKKLPIQCLDENGLVIKEAVITPAFANIYVRKGYEAKATVTLTQQQMETARQQQPVSVKPYVDMGIKGIIRESAEPVEVILQSETLLKPRAFQTTKSIGIFMSPELQNAYKVTISNADELRKTTTIYATDEAFRAYETVAYPLYIVIKDSDVVDLSEIPPKTVLYNFPPEYVKSGQIELDETKLPRSATIEIEPLNPVLTP